MYDRAKCTRQHMLTAILLKAITKSHRFGVFSHLGQWGGENKGRVRGVAEELLISGAVCSSDQSQNEGSIHAGQGALPPNSIPICSHLTVHSGSGLTR